MKVTKEEYENAITIVNQYRDQLIQELKLVTKETNNINPTTLLVDCNLSVRAKSVLHAAGHNPNETMIIELTKYKLSELRRFRNMGNKSIDEIQSALHEAGLKLEI